jgi:hypothetical protein
MKNSSLVIALLLLLTGICSCSGWNDELDVDINDPQQIAWVEDVIDEDLLNAIGVENINFGHTPPNLDTISFIVDKLRYDTCIRYRKITIQGVDYIEPSYNNPGLENSVYKHHFFNPNGNLVGHKMHIRAHTGDESTIAPDTTFVIGSGNNFTAYFQRKYYSEQEGNPTWAFLISGTLEYATDTTIVDNEVVVTKKFLGVSNYRIGKKILDIDTPPTQGYYPGTLMLMRPYNIANPIVPYHVWDTLPDDKDKFSLSFCP